MKTGVSLQENWNQRRLRGPTGAWRWLLSAWFAPALLLLPTGWLRAQTSDKAAAAASAVTDQAAFYGAFLPEVKLVRGGDQIGDPGTLLPGPIGVRVADGLQNAPVTFRVASGEALLTAGRGGDEKPAAALDVRAVVPRPKSPGNYEAQVYVHLPAAAGPSITIIATARSGEKTAEVRTSVSTADPALKPPTNVQLVSNTATTMNLRWTPSDIWHPTLVEITQDGGATWKLKATFPPGTSAGTVYHLRPDHPMSYRLRTGSKDNAQTPPP